MRAAVADNERRLRTLISLTLVPLFVVVVVLAAVVGAFIPILIAGLVIAVAIVGAVWARAEAIVLRSTGARRADRPGDERFRNLVEGLCVVSGTDEPDLYVMDDEALNLAVLGRGSRQASMVVTSGLLDVMDRVELEGVLAHGMARIRDHDIRPATFAAIIAMGCPPSIGNRICAYASPRARIDRADLVAVALTRYPPGLIAALAKIAAAGRSTSRGSRTMRRLWFVDPLAADPSIDGTSQALPTDGTHPPLTERIERLREL